MSDPPAEADAPRQAPPLKVKHPVVKLIPLAKVEVPAPPTFTIPDVWMTPAVEVETPTPSPVVIVALFATVSPPARMDNPPVLMVTPVAKVEVAFTVSVSDTALPRVEFPVVDRSPSVEMLVPTLVAKTENATVRDTAAPTSAAVLA